MIQGKAANIARVEQQIVELKNHQPSTNEFSKLMKNIKGSNSLNRLWSTSARQNLDRTSTSSESVVFPSYDLIKEVVASGNISLVLLNSLWCSNVTIKIATSFAKVLEGFKKKLAALKVEMIQLRYVENPILCALLVKAAIHQLEGPDIPSMETQVENYTTTSDEESILCYDIDSDIENYMKFLKASNLKDRMQDCVDSVQGVIALNGLNFVQIAALPSTSNLPFPKKFSNVYFKSVLQSKNLQAMLFGANNENDPTELIEARKWVELYGVNEKRFFIDFAFFFSQLFDNEIDAVPMVEESKKIVQPIIERNLSSRQEPEMKVVQPMLEHYFKEELKMFGFEAALNVEVTHAWRDRCLYNLTEILTKLKKLSGTKPQRNKVFMTVSSRLKSNPRFANYSFSLSNRFDRAAAMEAVQHEELNISKYKPVYVPKFVSEEEFFRNYFSHVLQLRIDLGATKKNLIIIASKNPAKLRSTESAFKSLFPANFLEGAVFEGRKSESGVSSQPLTDDETRQGSKNRCDHCFENKDDYEEVSYIVGIEGGLESTDHGLECFAWICVLKLCPGDDSKLKKEYSFSRSASFSIPQSVGQLLQQTGELGEATDKLFARKDTGKGIGLVGLVTKGVVDRIEQYRHACVLALAPFASPEIYNN